MAYAAHDDKQFVCTMPVFRGVAPGLLARVWDRRLPAVFEPGTVLFQQGDPAAHLYIMLEGTVKVVRSQEDGSEALISILGRGDTIAECAYCAHETYTFSAEAVTRARLLPVGVDTIADCVARDPGFALVLLRLQQRNLELLVDQVEQMKLKTAAQRVALFILRQRRGQTGTAVVELPYEKALIAQLLGMNPESFSRALAKLRELGVAVEGRSIRIGSVARLQAFARSE